LLAATGLRVSEALALQVEDLTDDGLLIRKTKFKKSRLVVLHGLEHLLALVIVGQSVIDDLLQGRRFGMKADRPKEHNKSPERKTTP